MELYLLRHGESAKILVRVGALKAAIGILDLLKMGKRKSQELQNP